MSIKLSFNKSNDENNSYDGESSVHLQYIPAKITKTNCGAAVGGGNGAPSDHDEQINIDKYFTNYTTQTKTSGTIDGNEETILLNSLRGHPMKGISDFNVPIGYRGVIFCEPNKPALSTELVNRELTEKYQFEKFTYWNYDKFPSANDSLKKAMDWMDVSKAIHNPILTEEIENFSFEKYKIIDKKEEKQHNEDEENDE